VFGLWSEMGVEEGKHTGPLSALPTCLLFTWPSPKPPSTTVLEPMQRGDCADRELSRHDLEVAPEA